MDETFILSKIDVEKAYIHVGGFVDHMRVICTKIILKRLLLYVNANYGVPN